MRAEPLEPVSCRLVTDAIVTKILLTLPPRATDDLEQALSGSGLSAERGGSHRGINQVAELLIVATPSVAALALLLEKLRRLKLPRTYVRVRDDALEIWTDPSHDDGRTFAVARDGTLTELPDPGLTIEAVRVHFGPPGR